MKRLIIGAIALLFCAFAASSQELSIPQIREEWPKAAIEVPQVKGNIGISELAYAVAKAFGRDTGMCVCAIFFAPIVFAILAFSKDIVYTGDKLTVFPESTNNN